MRANNILHSKLNNFFHKRVFLQLFLIFFLALFFLAPHINAQSNTSTPERIRIDSILKDSNNVPYEGFFSIKVRLFPGDDLDANALYEENFTDIYVANGFLSLILGSDGQLDPEIFNDYASIEYEISIGTDAGYIGTLTIPYAYKANYASTANAVLWENITGIPDYVKNSNAITSAEILNGSITNIDISPTASISFSKLNITARDISGLGFITQNATLSESAVQSIVNDMGFLTSVTSSNIVDAAAIPFSKLNITRSDIEGLGISTTLTDVEFDEQATSLGFLKSITSANIAEGETIPFENLSISKEQIESLGFTANVINDGTISTVKIADGAITTAKLGLESVTSEHILDGSITGADIQTGAISGSKLLNSTITNGKIADGTIQNAKLSSKGITNAKIADLTIINSLIATRTITYDRLNISKADLVNNLSIPTADTKLSEEDVIGFVEENGFLTVVTNDDVSGNIDFAKITVADNEISYNKLGIDDGSIPWQKLDPSTIDLDNIELSGNDIQDNSISTAKIQDYAVTFEKLSITKADLLTLEIPSENTQLSKEQVLSIVIDNGFVTQNTQLSEEQVVSFVIDNGFVTQNTQLSEEQVISFVLDNGFVTQNTQLSEEQVDAFVANNGYLTVVTNDDVSGNIDFSKITIANSAIDWTKIDPDSVDLSAYELGGDNLVTGSVNSNIILDGSIQAVDLALGIIGAAHIASGVLTTSHIATNAITASQLADNSVDTAAILNNAITNAKLADNAVGTDEITNLSITNEKIIDTQITYEKLNLANEIIPQAKVSNLVDDMTAILTSFNIQQVSIDTGSTQRNNFATTINNLVVTVNNIQTSLQYITMDNSELTYGGTIFATAFNGDGSALTNIAADTVAEGVVTTNSLANGAVTIAKMTLEDGDISIAKIDTLPDTLSTFTTSINAIEADITPLQIRLTNAETTINSLVDDFDLRNINIDGDAISFAGSITATTFSGSAVGLTNFPTDSITSAQIQALAVGTAELANEAVTNDQMADNSVASENIQTAAVDTDELAADAVTNAKLADDSVASENIQTSAVDTDELAADAVTNAKLADDSVASENIQTNAVDTDEIVDGAVTYQKLSLEDLDIPFSKLNITSANITSLGIDTEIADGSITNAKLAEDSVSSENILNGAIETAALAADAVTNAKLADDSVASENIQTAAVDTDELADGAITNAKLANDSVSSENIQAGAVETAALAADAVTNAKLADDSVASENIQTAAVDTDELADGAVTNAKIEDETINMSKLQLTIATDINVSFTKTIDWLSNVKHAITLTGDTTLSFTNPGGPISLTLIITQDATGSRVITWPAAVKWSGGIAPELSTAGGSVDIITLLYDGTSYYGFAAYAFE